MKFGVSLSGDGQLRYHNKQITDICGMQSMADKLTGFYRSLQPPKKLSKGIEILFPQKDPQVIGLVKKFLDKYFNDNKPRHLMFGINPGRFGVGITRVNFTGPRQLKENCGIDHHL